MEIRGGTAPTAPTAQQCPQCGTPVPVDEQYVAWCAECDWNVDPGAPDPEPGRIAAIRRRLARRHGEQLAAEMERARSAGGAARGRSCPWRSRWRCTR
ncbi:hypothetical protein ACFWC9_27305 [Streptomyces goshikiensis]|uniref:hypothetical protein n=1 Tax=Streptomyces goshikiensis TaxID=1942 RepID=UPI003695ACD7